LRKRRGGLSKRFEVRVDPFDIGVVRLLDDVSGIWLKVPCDRPELSVGVSMYQARVHIRTAKKMVKDGNVTEEDLCKARLRVKDESDRRLDDGGATTTAAKVARYALPNGEFITPLVTLAGAWTSNDDSSPVNVPQSLASEDVAPDNTSGDPPVAPVDLASAIAARLNQMKESA
jgi:putative transposase